MTSLVTSIPAHFTNFEPCVLDTLHNSQWHVEINRNRCRGFAECECLVNNALLQIPWVVASQRRWALFMWQIASDGEGCCDKVEGCCNSKLESLFHEFDRLYVYTLYLQMQNQNRCRMNLFSSQTDYIWVCYVENTTQLYQLVCLDEKKKNSLRPMFRTWL